MIYATKNMEKRERCNYSQRNNSIEAMFMKLEGWPVFESCGPTSMMSALNSVGYVTWFMNGVQEEDICTLFLNNPNNYPKLREIRDNLDPEGILGNRVPQYYSYMCDQLFKAKVEFFLGRVKDATVDNLKSFNAVQLCFDNPGHYIACVGFDSGTDEVIYNDPMGGFNERFHVSEFERFRNWGNIVYKRS